MEHVPPAHRRGAAGEVIACAFLAARGYRIAARNLRRGRAEIDVLAQRGELWVAIEVKWRAAGAGRAHQAWSPSQRARALAALSAVRVETDPDGRCDWRFDLIVIEERSDGLVLTHHRGAWSPAVSFW